MKIDHDWIKEYLGEKTPSPEKMEELLTFHAFEIEGSEHIGEHTVIDVDVLPNRSSDCLSHRGIARELATLLDTVLENDPLRKDRKLKATEKLSVTIENEHACRRFGLALIEGVTVQESPKWLRERLEALGQRSINNVVDITNYVMLALGQPLHAYDADKFAAKDGVWRFGIRFAKEGETITTLSKESYELDRSVQLIVNNADDAPAGIAGIKGGAYAEVDEHTKNIILEAGNFDPVVTRKASQFLKLQTDASKRFENEPAMELVPHALDEAAALVAECAGGTCVGTCDAYPKEETRPEVLVDPERVNKLLGLSLSTEEIEKILVRTGATVSRQDEKLLVRGPWERSDLTIEEDFTEEVGRIYGYEHVESVPPEPRTLTEMNARHYYSQRVRATLTNLGFSEVITSSFRKKDNVQLLNALASDKGCLRSSLQKNIESALDQNIHNVDLLGLDDVRIFEIGTVFEKGEEGVTEHTSLALGVRQKQTGYSPKDDEALKEALTKIEEELGTPVDWSTGKGVAEANFSELLEKLPEPKEYEKVEEGEEVQYRPFSVYPFILRDIAFWTDGSATAEEVTQMLKDKAGDLCMRVTLFDEFEKDGRTSYAFRLVFQSYEKTLTDDEVTAVMDRLYQVVSERGWEAR